MNKILQQQSQSYKDTREQQEVALFLKQQNGNDIVQTTK